MNSMQLFLLIVGITLVPALSLIYYLVQNMKDELKVKVPVRRDEERHNNRF